MGLLVVVLAAFVAIAIAAAYAKFRRRQARVAAATALAQRIGFSFSTDDVDHIVDMPFVLFGRGDKRAVELVVSGEHNGLPLKIFDYWYYDASTDAQGNQQRSYHRFTCAIMTIPAACPRLQLGHENMLTRLGSHFGLHDVEFEYDEFNRRFHVKCTDQKFAFSLFDAGMLQWILDVDTFDTVEVDGPWVLIAGPKIDPAGWLDLGTWLDQFHRRIPGVVFSTYPPR